MTIKPVRLRKGFNLQALSREVVLTERLVDLVDAIMHSDYGYEDFILKSLYKAQEVLRTNSQQHPAPGRPLSESERLTQTVEDLKQKGLERIEVGGCAPPVIGNIVEDLKREFPNTSRTKT